MAIQSVNEELCSGCGTCVDNCPMDVFRMDEKANKAFVAYPEDCAVCYMCEKDCPEGAIILTPDAAEKMVFPFG